MVAWPYGPRLFEHLRSLAAPIRLDDMPAYVRALGFSHEVMPSKTMMGTPLRHRDINVGNFFLGEKEGGREFTSDDEEVLTLFAAQAATAIANARAHREERRARADLETLIETSPVGVVVFDGRAGEPVSFNREARRIVDGLSNPGSATPELLELITCHRADGREVALAEFPLAQLLGTAEKVRAEEITLSVPDGRSVTTLVNSTPILGDDGSVLSVVVTLQDLGPLEELERMRAEFLGIVSHELRTPLISIKGSTATVLGASQAPDPAEMLQFFRVIDDQADRMRGLIGELLRPRADRDGYAVGFARARCGRLAGGPGPRHVRERHGQTYPQHRPARGPAARAGRPGPHRPGAGQPSVQRGQVFSGSVSHRNRRCGGRPAHGDLRDRPGPRRAAGPAAAPLPQVRPSGRRRPRARVGGPAWA